MPGPSREKVSDRAGPYGRDLGNESALAGDYLARQGRCGARGPAGVLSAGRATALERKTPPHSGRGSTAGPQHDAECPAAATIGVAQLPKQPDGGTTAWSQVAGQGQEKSAGRNENPAAACKGWQRRGHASDIPPPTQRFAKGI